MSSSFDDDTAVTLLGEGRYGAAVTDRWTVGGGPNGGYLAAILLRAVLAESPLPDPVTMTVHYLSRPQVAPCDVQVSTLRVGRGHASFRAELVQGDEIRCAALMTIGRWREPGALDFQPPAPDVPGPERCAAVRRLGEAQTLFDQLETRVVSSEDLFALRSDPGEAETGGWTRLSGGRPTDALAVALFLDCWPPAVFSRTMRPDALGVPTIEYTVHWRARPGSDWCYGRFESRTLAGGYVDEHGVLFDEAGILVAESRQIARYLG